MRKILSTFLTIVVIFTFAGCSNNASNDGDTLPETSVVSKNSSTDEQDNSQTDSGKEVTPVKKMITMNIKIGNNTFTATLEDNDTVKDLVTQLPITIDMSELNGNEKYHKFPTNLSEEASSYTGKINEGDLMIYSKDYLVLFYKTFNTSYNYVKLGHIDDTKGLDEAVGSGSVKVTFSQSE